MSRPRPKLGTRMPTRAVQPCAHREVTDVLAGGRLVGVERQHAERHLEHCELCRTAFRQLTAERFPKIRNYTVLREIGRGGFGVVYKAVHHGKERIEALKVLSGKTARRTAYFENEVHVAAKLRHPNIATLYDAHLRTPPLYYAMEFVEGQQLDDYLRFHDVSLERRIELLHTVALAVDYAHQQGIIHRDLKPQNILIDDQGHPHIVDFGISKQLALPEDADEVAEATAERPEGPLGTYGYMAPEQLAGQPVDGRADLYGLGALLFHVITGQAARFARHTEHLIRLLRERHVSRAEDLAAIIACCVATVPEQRYPACGLLAAELKRYLAGELIQAREDATAGYRVARIAALVLRNHPLPVQVAVAVVIALMVTWLFWRAGAGWLAPTGPGQTALIAFTSSTLDALQAKRIGAEIPGLDPAEHKSWRLLYGQLMEKLADANPRVVVWDYYFPDSQPQFDAGFVQGVRALRAPVVVGSREYDVNGEPVLCPEIRAAVHGWGAVPSVNPAFLHAELVAPLALQRGVNPPLASLAVAGFAAARFPGCETDIRIENDRLQLRYRKRQIAARERRWQGETDLIPIFDVSDARPRDAPLATDDKAILGRFRLAGLPIWARQAITFEDVLTADAAQRRRWFAGRAVVIGQMLPGIDTHKLGSGEAVHGCQVQALLLDALLATYTTGIDRAGIVWRMCLWCALAALLVNLVPVRSTWPLRTVIILGGGVCIAGVALAPGVALGITSRWAVEAGIGLSALLASGGPLLLVRLLHQRQLHLTPGPVWPIDATTASTTILAPSPEDSPSGPV